MTERKVRVLLYNDQTVSPITSRVRSAAQAAGVPVIGVSETLPAHTTFQAWQVAQVDALRAALAR
jgi:zinc/manganese transport system substrate-binding protein